MKLGGFVIHGNAVSTLGRALDSLCATCDEVVALDSQSTDGSADVARRAGVRVANRAWRGFGAARAHANQLLASCDAVFYLDSDEWLAPPEIDTFRRWKAEAVLDVPIFTMKRRNWVRLGDGAPFVQYVDLRARVLRRGDQGWTDSMIVHELLPSASARRSTGVTVDHDYVTQLSARTSKHRLYALLWAIQAHAQHQRAKPAALSSWASFLKDALFRGAMFRGGARGVRVAWHASRYTHDKYVQLAAIRRGAHAELCQLYQAGEYERLFELASRAV